MRGSLLRIISLYSHRRFLSPSTYTTNPIPSLVPLAASTQSRLSFYSSESSESSRDTEKYVSDDDVSDVSKEELKKLIDKYFEGDVEAIPSIFEAILQRKLAGLLGKKNDENDDDEKLIEELCGKKELGQESESDFEDRES